VCATGGGAFKFEQDFLRVRLCIIRKLIELIKILKLVRNFPFPQEVNTKLEKFDELDALIKGILYTETQNPTECYYYQDASDIR
jgi:type II pantothenate kinase